MSSLLMGHHTAVNKAMYFTWSHLWSKDLQTSSVDQVLRSQWWPGGQGIQGLTLSTQSGNMTWDYKWWTFVSQGHQSIESRYYFWSRILKTTNPSLARGKDKWNYLYKTSSKTRLWRFFFYPMLWVGLVEIPSIWWRLIQAATWREIHTSSPFP